MSSLSVSKHHKIGIRTTVSFLLCSGRPPLAPKLLIRSERIGSVLECLICKDSKATSYPCQWCMPEACLSPQPCGSMEHMSRTLRLQPRCSLTQHSQISTLRRCTAGAGYVGYVINPVSLPHLKYSCAEAISSSRSTNFSKLSQPA